MDNSQDTRSRSNSNERESDNDQNVDNNGSDNNQDPQETGASATPAPSTQPPQPQPEAPFLVDPDAIVAVHRGRPVGVVTLRYSADISNIRIPPQRPVSLPAQLTIFGQHISLINTTQQNPQALTRPPRATNQSGSSKLSTSRNDNKRRTATDHADEPALKVPKIVTSIVNSDPKPASHYDRGIEEPSGMTKNEHDSCLTCLRHNRRCKGTKLELVKGDKRCETCAHPGTNTGGRVCYWKNSAEGIHTYGDAKEKLGGRVLQKNTRQGRQERKEKKEAKTRKDEESQRQTSEPASQQDDQEQADREGDEEETLFDPDLLSAAGTAYESLYNMAAQFAGIAGRSVDHTVGHRLVVERQILQYMDHPENNFGQESNPASELDAPVLVAVRVQVEDAIAHLESQLDVPEENREDENLDSLDGEDSVDNVE